MIKRSKRLRLLLAVTLVAGLIAVALPLCVAPSCDEPAMPVHLSSPGPLQSAITAVCNMALTVPRAVDSVLPTFSPASLLGLVLAVLLIGFAVSGLLHRSFIGRAAAALGRLLAPPGDLAGVRLLI